MTKKTFLIKVIHEFGELIDLFGKFEEKDIQLLVKKAIKENMSCLLFVDLHRDTYFNELQCKDIKKEISILKSYKELSKVLLDSIEKAVDETIKREVFLKFEVVEL